MNFRNVVFFAVLLAPLSAFAQFPISLGVKGGTALTDAFSDRTVLGVDTDSHTYSQKKDYIVGPMLEVHLPFGFSAEADALYRPLNLTNAFTVIAGGTTTTTSTRTVNTWEFPILAKYHLPFPIVKPFIEAGPSFRHVSQFPGDSPHISTKGFSAGVGVEAKLLVLRISPEIRYTHWGADSKPSTSAFDPRTNANQAEFLVGISF